MGFLMLLIAIGYVLVKTKVVPSEGAGLLSKLENFVFIPALVLGTFLKDFTVNKLSTAWQYVVCGIVVVGISSIFAVFVSKLCSKDKYIQNIYTYGLSFANFGFMGNAVVQALFPKVFADYLIYVIPFWILIYVWGVPYLLMPKNDNKKNIFSGLKNLINPMFIALFLGAIIGLSGLKMPKVITTVVTSCGNCMSPLAMVLSGMVFATINLKSAFTNLSVYICSVLRLIIFPVLFAVVFKFVPIDKTWYICLVCSTAMPLVLNAIVIPAADGKDLTVPAGMAVVSHLLAVITIPIMFCIFI
jgi:predicted permease